MADEQPHPVKRRRVTQACDYCHQRSIRCRIDEADTSRRCVNCVAFNQACTRDRPTKKRGVKPRKDQQARPDSSSPYSVLPPILPPPSASSHEPWRPQSSLTGASPTYADDYGPPNPAHVGPVSLPPLRRTEPWRAPYIASQALIVDLVEVYFEVVYPIFPWFHRPSFLRKISRGEYHDDRPLFACTMAVCALSSARASDNALADPSTHVQELSSIPSQTFHDAAVDALPKSDTPEQSLNIMRTYALLSLIAIQYGRPRDMQGYLGKYHALVSMDRLHDEANWPSNLGIIELEERRRLFWSIYTLDIFSSIVFKSVIHCREQQSSVHYTTEVDDAFFDDSGYRFDPQSPASSTSPSSSVSPDSWLNGWNVTTDLWRLIEHVTIKLHSHTRRRRTFSQVATNFENSPSAATLQAEVDRIYFSLPIHFRNIEEKTGDATRDRYGFQAANITATVQLLRMVLLASEENTIEQRCQVVSEVVHAFMRVPVAYLKAISSPLLHHLASIGAVLGGVLEERLTEYQYRQVRTVLLALAQLVENVDLGMHSVQVAKTLRDLVVQIDDHMSAHRRVSTTSPTSARSGGLQLPQDLLTEWPWKTGPQYP